MESSPSRRPQPAKFASRSPPPSLPAHEKWASGRHYSSSSRFPFIAGVVGVARLHDGSRVYFILPTAPHRAMAERTVAPGGHCLALPGDLDDVAVAAIVNPGISSWAAYSERASPKAGGTVLVDGATGAAGRLAVQVAKHRGAKKIIATGRSDRAPEAVAAVGADVTIPLPKGEAALEEGFMEKFAQGVDVVIDYLWGKSA